MIQYITQMLVFQVVFLLFYDLLLKKETFFGWNRIYLLATSVLSVVLPLVKINGFKNIVPKEYVIALPEIVLRQAQKNIAPKVELVATSSTEFQWNWKLVYYIGLFIAFAVFVYKIYKIVKLITTHSVEKRENIKLVRLVNDKEAFSFFNYIFLGKCLSKAERNYIIQHEIAHIKQGHTWDLLYFELLRIVCWFNPFIYIYQNRISTLHEFIADAEVSKNQNKKAYYQSLLSQVFNTNTISFINPFFKKSLIKKRIVMLQKSKSRKVQLFKYLLLMPLITGMLVYSSCSDDGNQKDQYDLSQYTYKVKLESDMSKESKVIHEKYETFLKANPEYVSWAEINTTKKEVVYSVHSVDEKVPDGFFETKVSSPDGASYVMYINFPKDEVEPEDNNSKNKFIDEEYISSVEVPFSFIEKIPVFPGCDSNTNNETQKECFNKEIAQFVGRNFNTQLGKELGLTGLQKIYVLFKIGTDGKIFDVKARAPHSALEAEAVRVVNMLPEFIPGEQKGKKVVVPYSLPISFSVQ